MNTIPRPIRVLARASVRPGIARARPSILSASLSSTSRNLQQDPQHTTRKSDTLDVQSNNSARARESKSQGRGGTATTQSDDQKSTQKAKEEHPEAPGVVIGMQDERGGKGV